MSPVEKEHIVRAYTFELGKCYEQAIKERQLQCLANIDPTLCQEVATGLGLPAPEPTIPLTEVVTSPALSQVGETWPGDGRMVGVVVDPDGSLDGLREVRQAVFAADMVPLVVAPHGGMVDGVPVQRTFATGRSVELDAVVLLGAPASGPDALPARDAKAGAGDSTVIDPRLRLLLEECWRHAKVIGATGAGIAALEQAGLAGTPGVVTAESAADVFTQVQELMAFHRVWERFPATLD
jgi:catalase